MHCLKRVPILNRLCLIRLGLSYAKQLIKEKLFRLQYVELPVRFAPVSHGIFAADLEVLSDDPARSPVRVPVVGGSDPSITAEPSHLKFGMVVIGETATRRISIGNRGDTPLSLTGISLPHTTFTAQADFTVLAPGQVGNVEVGFKPIEEGDLLESIVLGFSGPVEKTVVLRLSGSGGKAP